MKNKAKIIIPIAATGGALVLLLIFSILWHVKPIQKEIRVELGHEVSSNPGDYLKGIKWAVNMSKVDVSEVNDKRIGEYTAYTRHGLRKDEYTIIVEDTTAPMIVGRKEDHIYLKAGVVYAPDDFITTVKDASESITLNLKADGVRHATVQYDEIGDYEVEIKAEDASGNRSSKTISFTVDTPPVIEGTKDCYVTAGKEQSDEVLLQTMYAYDDVDGEMTDDVKLDSSRVDWNTEGEYPVLYSVTDQYGLHTTVQETVYVLSQSELDHKLSKREINRHEDIIEGATNIYDAGAAAWDLDRQEQYMLPAVVHIYIEIANGHCLGSGYVMQIKDGYVYIVSNNHVYKEGPNGGEIYFYDGSCVRYEFIGANAECDTAVARVPFDALSEKMKDEIMTVHVSQSAYDDLIANGGTLFFDKINRQGVEYFRDGKPIGMCEEFLDFLPSPTLEYTVVQIPGNSGSAVMDAEGNLIAMATYNYGSSRHFGVTMPYIVKAYEEITGNTLFKD